MKKIVILGSGKIGRMVCFLLGTCGDYEVQIGDMNLEGAHAAAATFGGKGEALSDVATRP